MVVLVVLLLLAMALCIGGELFIGPVFERVRSLTETGMVGGYITGWLSD